MVFSAKLGAEMQKVMPDLTKYLKIDAQLEQADLAFFGGLVVKRQAENKFDKNDLSIEGIKKQPLIFNSVLNELADKVLPSVLFQMRAVHTIATLVASKGEDADIEAFKKTFKSNVDEFSTAFRQQGKSEAADYIKR